MKTKINTKKRNVKKKRIKSLPKSRQIGRATSGLQKKAWGKKLKREASELAFFDGKADGQWDKKTMAKLAKKHPGRINIIHKTPGGISGDPFSIKGNEETLCVVDLLQPFQRKVNERESHLADALRYCHAQIDASDKAPFVLKPATRGELGTAPAHYSHGKYTPWEIVDDWKLEYYTGNAMKYVCRHKHKGTPVQDIQKAIDCLIKYKANLEKEIP